MTINVIVIADPRTMDREPFRQRESAYQFALVEVQNIDSWSGKLDEPNSKCPSDEKLAHTFLVQSNEGSKVPVGEYERQRFRFRRCLAA